MSDPTASSPPPDDRDRRFLQRYGWALVAAGVLALFSAAVVWFVVERDDDDPPATAQSESGRTVIDGFGEVAATVRPPASGDSGSDVLTILCLMLADTTELRSQGLMGVTDRSLGGHDGMLFEFSADTAGAFWMRNTPLPLSIAFFDAEGRLVSTADMEPCAEDTSSCPTYGADGPYRYALEVPRGELAELGITDGATLELGGACEPVGD